MVVDLRLILVWPSGYHINPAQPICIVSNRATGNFLSIKTPAGFGVRAGEQGTMITRFELSLFSIFVNNNV